MSVFGDMDTDTISDDPWGVADNWYFVSITKCYQNSKDGQDYLHFVYSIDEPDSEFHGTPVRERYEIYPWANKPEDLDGEQKKMQKRLKNRFVKGYGLNSDEVRYYAENVEELIGKTLYIKVKNNSGKVGTEHENTKFSNVADALNVEEYEARQEKQSSVSSTSGLL